MLTGFFTISMSFSGEEKGEVVYCRTAIAEGMMMFSD